MNTQHALNRTVLKVYACTALWAAVLIAMLVLTRLKRDQVLVSAIPYSDYRNVVWIVGPLLVGLILYGVYRASRYIPMSASSPNIGPWYGDWFLVALLIFWALGPPSYFFVEYYAFEEGLLQCWNHEKPKKDDKVPCLEDVRIYGDLASKFWAGAGAVLLAFTALAKSSPLGDFPASKDRKEER